MHRSGQVFLRGGVLSAAQAEQPQNLGCFVHDLIMSSSIMFLGSPIHKTRRAVTTRSDQSCHVSVSKMKWHRGRHETCLPNPCCTYPDPQRLLSRNGTRLFPRVGRCRIPLFSMPEGVPP
jgi:hypothetical protein